MSLRYSCSSRFWAGGGGVLLPPGAQLALPGNDAAITGCPAAGGNLTGPPTAHGLQGGWALSSSLCRLQLISSKVPKAEYIPTIIRRDDPSIIPILYVSLSPSPRCWVGLLPEGL